MQHRLKREFDPHVDISVTYLWPQDDAKSQLIKTWLDVSIFPYDGRATTKE